MLGGLIPAPENSDPDPDETRVSEQYAATAIVKTAIMPVKVRAIRLEKCEAFRHSISIQRKPM
jgi:hypothetical protein